LKQGTIMEHFGARWVDMDFEVIASTFFKDPNIASKMWGVKRQI